MAQNMNDGDTRTAVLLVGYQRPRTLFGLHLRMTLTHQKRWLLS